MKLKKFLKNIVLGSAFLSFSGGVYAQMPSQAQIEQFKRMPKAQQEALARQFGIDVSLITGGGLGSSTDDIALKQQDSERIGEQALNIEQLLFEKQVESNFEEVDEIKRFGVEMFKGQVDGFTPQNNIPVPADYTVGVGDVLKLQLYGKENSSDELIVGRDGNILFPGIGPITVAGMSYGELKKAIVSIAQEKMIGVNANVFLSELRAIQVFIVGDALKPGPYVLGGLSTVSHALFASGGVNDIGSLRDIKLKRAGKVISNFDLYDILVRGDTSADVRLQSGDVIFIPPVAGLVRVEGEVRRKAIYELNPGDSVSDIIGFAGGVNASAHKKGVSITRINDNNLKTIINIDLTSQEADTIVKDGDEILIGKVSESFSSSVRVTGAVVRSGEYQWKEGLRVSVLVPSFESSLLPETDLEYSLIVSTDPSTRRISIKQFNLADVLSNRGGEGDPILKPNDELIVMSRYLVEEISEDEEDLEISLNEKTEQELLIEQEIRKKQGLTVELSPEQKELGNQLAQASFKETSPENDAALEDQEEADYSRAKLLAPVIQKLRSQATALEKVKTASITGAVKVPGEYPVSTTTSVLDLIEAAGGLKESAFIDSAELVRLISKPGSAAKYDYKRINLRGELMGGNSLTLLPRDQIVIHHTPDWADEQVIELKGEVMFPGTYTFRKGEHLSDLIKRAGGFSSHAHIKAAIFTRDSIKEAQKKQYQRLAVQLNQEVASMSFSKSSMSQMASFSEAQKIIQSIEDIEPVGRMVINLPGVIAGESQYDVLLQSGDALYIPPKKSSVGVMGMVQFESSHFFDQSAGLETYLDMSGGIKAQADEERIYVVKADGSVRLPYKNRSTWFAANNQGSLVIEPGDTVIVPMDITYMDNLSLWSTVTQIIGQTGIALAAIARL